MRDSFDFVVTATKPVNSYKSGTQSQRRHLLKEHVANCGRKRPDGSWDDLVQVAREVYEERYKTSGVRSSLRYLFYHLVVLGYLRNTTSESTQLSKYTAVARREGDFPRLVDHNREISRPFSWDSLHDAMQWSARRQLKRDAGQPDFLMVLVEKSTVAESVKYWLDDYGIPVVALRGYGSQTICDVVTDEVEDEVMSVAVDVVEELGERRAILFTIGDFDASGWHLMKLFVDRTRMCWTEVEQIGVTFDQVEELGLPQAPAKETDPRIGPFVREFWPAQYGRIQHDMRGCKPAQIAIKLAEAAMQVEVEALEAAATNEDPEPLRTLLMDAIGNYWDEDAAATQRAKEGRMLRALAQADEAELTEWLTDQGVLAG